LAYRGDLGLYMAVRGTANATHADIESRIAPAWSFRCLGCIENRGAVITLSFLTPSLLSIYLQAPLVHLTEKGKAVLSGVCIKQSIAITTCYENLNLFLNITAPKPSSRSVSGWRRDVNMLLDDSLKERTPIFLTNNTDDQKGLKEPL
jgi:hypothetical protein